MTINTSSSTASLHSYLPMNENRISRRMLNHPRLAFVRFIAVGVFATALHYGLYLMLRAWMPLSIAYTVGYATSFVVNFYLTAYFTFHSAPSWNKFAGMAGAHGVNYLLHICLLNLFLWLGIRSALAPIPVFAIAVPVNFLLVKFVFKRS